MRFTVAEFCKKKELCWEQTFPAVQNQVDGLGRHQRCIDVPPPTVNDPEVSSPSKEEVCCLPAEITNFICGEDDSSQDEMSAESSKADILGKLERETFDLAGSFAEENGKRLFPEIQIPSMPGSLSETIQMIKYNVHDISLDLNTDVEYHPVPSPDDPYMTHKFTFTETEVNTGIIDAPLRTSTPRPRFAIPGGPTPALTQEEPEPRPRELSLSSGSLNDSQTMYLAKEFSSCIYVGLYRHHVIAEELGVTPDTVLRYFRRQRERQFSNLRSMGRVKDIALITQHHKDCLEKIDEELKQKRSAAIRRVLLVRRTSRAAKHRARASVLQDNEVMDKFASSSSWVDSNVADVISLPEPSPDSELKALVDAVCATISDIRTPSPTEGASNVPTPNNASRGPTSTSQECTLPTFSSEVCVSQIASQVARQIMVSGDHSAEQVTPTYTCIPYGDASKLNTCVSYGQSAPLPSSVYPGQISRAHLGQYGPSIPYPRHTPTHQPSASLPFSQNRQSVRHPNMSTFLTHPRPIIAQDVPSSSIPRPQRYHPYTSYSRGQEAPQYNITPGIQGYSFNGEYRQYGQRSSPFQHWGSRY